MSFLHVIYDSLCMKLVSDTPIFRLKANSFSAYNLS